LSVELRPAVWPRRRPSPLRQGPRETPRPIRPGGARAHARPV